ncbi:alanyl-tRNA editing protein [Brevibacillus sp. SYSU BS000544]|uniref:alanyl-tRNA editing protein n=1 Tax=Brevibacillus sp. SYSU BS000544 TaxID=3416443 RepID=UPI003CE4E954
MKDRLYYQDAYIQEFNATVTNRGIDPIGNYIELSKTAFYPTGGGQPCDTGMIQGICVTQVEEVDGQIRHYLESPLPEDVAEIEGRIDWARRFDHMQQHNGQHILSAAFYHQADIATIGFHLGKEIVTIDLDTAELTEDLVRSVEDVANQMVVNNRPIEARFVSQEELAKMPIRKAPTVTENIRMVIIPDFDYNLCGGTHPRFTGEVGMIKVIGWERNKGKIRLSFVSGSRVLGLLRDKMDVLQSLTRLLTCGEGELLHNMTRVLDEQKDSTRQLQEARLQLMEYEISELREQAITHQGMHIITKVLDQASMQELQRMAQTITARFEDSVVLLASEGERTQLVFARGQGISLDATQLLKQVLPLIDGKGGGKPEMGQGGGAGTVSGETIIKHALELIVSSDK